MSIKDAINLFESVQNKHLDSGAGDTEPNTIFQKFVVHSTIAVTQKLNLPEIPSNWRLFLDHDPKADEELSKAAVQVLKEIQTTFVAVPKQGWNDELLKDLDYIKEYCWRIC